MKTICQKCGNEITNNNLKRHIEKCDGSGTNSLKREKSPKKGSKECNLLISEKTKIALSKKEIREKISNSLIGKSTGKASSEEKELERKKKISETAKRNKIAGGLRHGSGRGKKGWYKGYFCDSSWELAFVIYNLEHEIKFIRNKEGFEYIFEGKKHKYYPDFIIDNIYYEIKGYRTKQSEEKHEQFLNKLEVIDKYKIRVYLEYVENKYGKDYIKLYE